MRSKTKDSLNILGVYGQIRTFIYEPEMQKDVF